MQCQSERSFHLSRYDQTSSVQAASRGVRFRAILDPRFGRSKVGERVLRGKSDDLGLALLLENSAALNGRKVETERAEGRYCTRFCRTAVGRIGYWLGDSDETQGERATRKSPAPGRDKEAVIAIDQVYDPAGLSRENH